MRKYLLLFIIIYIFLYSRIFAEYQQLPGFPFIGDLNTPYTNQNGPGVVNINDDPYL